jgi:hypothetical protein
MHNPGIKNSRDINVLNSIRDDGGQTVLACWETDPPEEAQAAFDAFVPQLTYEFEVRGNPAKFIIRSHDWKKYRSMTPYFRYASQLAEIHRDIVRDPRVRPLTEFFRPGKLLNSGELHADYPQGTPQERIAGIAIMRSGKHATGGELQCIDIETASEVTPDPDPKKRPGYVIADESKIQTVPLSSFALFSNPELYHRGTPVQNGYRARIMTGIPGLIW